MWMEAAVTCHVPQWTQENHDEPQVNRGLGRDSNREPLECKPEKLPLHPTS
jgi:hypothetical protein